MILILSRSFRYIVLDLKAWSQGVLLRCDDGPL